MAKQCNAAESVLTLGFELLLQLLHAPFRMRRRLRISLLRGQSIDFIVW